MYRVKRTGRLHGDGIAEVAATRMIPALEEIAQECRVPMPGHLDIILPEFAYSVHQAVIHGKKVPATYCVIYLRCYRGGYDILLVDATSDTTVLFETDAE